MYFQKLITIFTKKLPPVIRNLTLPGFVFFLFLVGERPPQFTQLLSNSTKGEVRLVFLNLGAMLLAEEHESRKRLLALAAALLGGGLQSSKEEKEKKS